MITHLSIRDLRSHIACDLAQRTWTRAFRDRVVTVTLENYGRLSKALIAQLQDDGLVGENLVKLHQFYMRDWWLFFQVVFESLLLVSNLDVYDHLREVEKCLADPQRSKEIGSSEKSSTTSVTEVSPPDVSPSLGRSPSTPATSS